MIPPKDSAAYAPAREDGLKPWVRESYHEDWERTAAGDFDAGFAVDVLRSRASELLEAVSEQAA